MAEKNPRPDKPSDGEVRALLDRARTGDGPALSRLLELYGPLLSATVSRYARDLPGSEDRKDMRQELEIAFVRAVESYRTDSSDVTFGLYAKVVTRNAAVTYLRRARAGKRVRSGATRSVPAEGNVRAPRELRERLDRVRKDLSAYETAVLEKYLDGLKPAQIAAELGSSPKSVSNALARIRKKARNTEDNA